MILDERFADSWTSYLNRHGTQALLERDVFKRRLYRQRRSILYPPPLFAKSYMDDLAKTSIELIRIVSSIPQRIFSGDIQAWMEFLGMHRPDCELLLELCSPRLLERATYFGRPDFLPTTSGAKVTEINVSAPIGGMATCQPFLEEFLNTGFGRYLVEKGASFALPQTTQVWLQALMALCPVARATDAPILFEAIANPADIDVGRQLFVSMARQGGFSVACGLIAQLNVTASGVYLDGQRIHTIFTMFTWAELRRHVSFDLVRALVKADADGLVDFIAPPVSALFDHKANFELLTSDEFTSFFSEQELALLRRSIPRTFRLIEARVARALLQRDVLVLKPADEYGGKGIVFGAHTSPSEWESAVMEAVGSGKAFVCQEKICNLWSRPVLLQDEVSHYITCLGPMIFGGQYAGVFIRQSLDRGRTPVINVSHGAEEGSGIICA